MQMYRLLAFAWRGQLHQVHPETNKMIAVPSQSTTSPHHRIAAIPPIITAFRFTLICDETFHRFAVLPPRQDPPS